MKTIIIIVLTAVALGAGYALLNVDVTGLFRALHGG